MHAYFEFFKNENTGPFVLHHSSEIHKCDSITFEDCSTLLYTLGSVLHNFLPCSFSLAKWPIWPDQTENSILPCKCLNRQSERNGSGGLLKPSNRITCEGYANLTVCVLCMMCPFVWVRRLLLIQYPTFPTFFSFTSAALGQDMINSCAKAVLSDMCLHVWLSLCGLWSCFSDGHTLEHPGNHVPEISNVILCMWMLFLDDGRWVSVGLKCPGLYVRP